MNLAHAMAAVLLLAAGGHEAEEAAGASSAGAWLALVDDARYRESWVAAAPVVRQTVSEVKWEETLDAVRIPLGHVHARKLLSAHYIESLPASVVMQYRTSFDGGSSAVEIVTTQLDSQGVWRVARYFVR